MRHICLIACLLALTACSTQPGTSPDAGEARQDTDESAGACGPARPCPDRLVCEQGYCVRPVADVGPDTEPADARDTAPGDVADSAADSGADGGDGRDAGDTPPGTVDAGPDTNDTAPADTRPHWDAGVNCQPSTVCCDLNGNPDSFFNGDRKPCGQSRGPNGEALGTMPRYRCQQGACRACECSEGACCDGCFFKAPTVNCSTQYDSECRGGDKNHCGGQLYRTKSEHHCSGYSADCPETPTSSTTKSVGSKCPASQECIPSTGNSCRPEINSDCG